MNTRLQYYSGKIGRIPVLDVKGMKETEANLLRKWRPVLFDKMKLVDNTIRSFRVAKVFRENSDRVNHIDFSPNGETLISSSNDDSIVIYDCLEGK